MSDLPLGPPVPHWTPPPRPERAALEGPRVRVAPLDPAAHAAELFAAFEGHDALWTYLSHGPYADLAALRVWLDAAAVPDDPLVFALVDRAGGRAVGVAAYMRVTPEAGTIEIGHLVFSPALQRTPVATEALALMAANAFALGYRRLEWKCNALNAASRRAAQRLGFSFEGVHRQAAVMRGRSRDTAWYSILDREWPALRAAHDAWLDPANFDAEGRQRTALSALTWPLLASVG